MTNEQAKAASLKAIVDEVDHLYFEIKRKPWEDSMFDLGVPLNDSLLFGSHNKYREPLDLNSAENRALSRLYTQLKNPDVTLLEGRLQKVIEISHQSPFLNRRESVLYSVEDLGELLDPLKEEFRAKAEERRLEGLGAHYFVGALLNWSGQAIRYFEIWKDQYLHLAIPFTGAPVRKKCPFYRATAEHHSNIKSVFHKPFGESTYFGKMNLDLEAVMGLVELHVEGLESARNQSAKFDTEKIVPVQSKQNPLPSTLLVKGEELLGRKAESIADYVHIRVFAGWAKRLHEFYHDFFLPTLGTFGVGLTTSLFLNQHGVLLGPEGKTEAKALMNDAFNQRRIEYSFLPHLGSQKAFQAAGQVYEDLRQAFLATERLPKVQLKSLIHEPKDFVKRGISFYEHVQENIRGMAQFPAQEHLLVKNQFFAYALTLMDRFSKFYDSLPVEKKSLPLSSLTENLLKEPGRETLAREARNMYGKFSKKDGYLKSQKVSFHDFIDLFDGYRDDIVKNYT